MQILTLSSYTFTQTKLITAQTKAHCSDTMFYFWFTLAISVSKTRHFYIRNVLQHVGKKHWKEKNLSSNHGNCSV